MALPHGDPRFVIRRRLTASATTACNSQPVWDRGPREHLGELRMSQRRRFHVEPFRMPCVPQKLYPCSGFVVCISLLELPLSSMPKPHGTASCWETDGYEVVHESLTNRIREMSPEEAAGHLGRADPVCQISHCMPPSFCCWIPDGALWNGDRRLGLSHTRWLVWWAQGAPESDTSGKSVDMEK
ncbi:hypothetical protein F5144DRAFT_270488 [Chaetomium tenue]|uniref:Uncharacterized protein n=1 Tax=Chaetomium tenue TaxID=1854479 RepID=A0ACB7P019_9PEZI|nr:hypothetical protein F5144DRAFT_270488 [Chaetomium globosum]